ncbi:MAG: hypothetical protein IKJ63_11410 [Clostridia bacterium]|nr:hypothetical protein [Clostridia bacterium]
MKNWMFSFVGKRDKVKKEYRTQTLKNRITLQYLKETQENNKSFNRYYRLYIAGLLLVLPAYCMVAVCGLLWEMKTALLCLAVLLAVKGGIELIAFGQFGSAPAVRGKK